MNEYIVIESEQDWPEINVGLALLENKLDEASRFLYAQLIEGFVDGDFILNLSAEEVASVVKREWA